jgi:Holliday junction resolvase
VKHFRVFRSKCYIKREDDRLGKFDSRFDKGILFGYSRKIKSYKFFSPRLNRTMESINVTIDEKGIQKDKEGSKNSEEKDDEEYIIEE